MATSKDFEKLWKRYQDEVQPDANTLKQEASKHPNQDSMWIRSFTIQFRNGLEIRHQNISYSSLASLVEKLEVLC